MHVRTHTQHKPIHGSTGFTLKEESKPVRSSVQRDTCIQSRMLTVSSIRNFVHIHQHKLMHALFLCLSHSVWKQRTFLSISDPDFLSNVLFRQSDQNDLYSFGLFVFQLKKDMALLGILACTMNDCEISPWDSCDDCGDKCELSVR